MPVNSVEEWFRAIEAQVREKVEAAVFEAAEAAYRDVQAKLAAELVGTVKLTMMQLPYTPTFEIRVVFGAPPAPPEEAT